MKAVLVIDLPNELDVNDLLIDYCVHTKGKYKTIRKGGNHPLKPLPETKERIDGEEFREWECEDYYTNGYANGWNDCLDVITGENE